MFRRDKMTFEHYDSMRGSHNNEVAREIAGKMTLVICGKEGSKAGVQFATPRCAQQRNGCDCGLYLLKFAHILGLGRCCDGAVKAVVTVKPEDVSGFRTFVRKVIDTVGEERRKKLAGKVK